MAKGNDSEVIRWRRHTPKSKIYAIGAQALIFAGAALMVSGIGGNIVPPLLVIAAVVVIRVGQKWMTEVIRPRPKRAIDKRDFGRLLAAQFAAMLAICAVLLWLGYSAAEGSIGLPIAMGGALAGLALLSVTSKAFRDAYDRLFERIASRDGAYGL